MSTPYNPPSLTTDETQQFARVAEQPRQPAGNGWTAEERAERRARQGPALTDFDQKAEERPAGQPQNDEDARYRRFRAAEAARAGWDEAKLGNGSESPFIRWLTRKPLPVKMTGYRIACGLCWAFWTVIFTVGTFAYPGNPAMNFFFFLLAALSGLYDWRIWTKRASRLSWLIIF